MSRKLSSSVRGVAAGLAALSAAVVAQPSAAAEKVTYAYATNVSLSNAPSLMAFGMGYFKEEGLDVEVTFFQGASVMLPQIIQKHITFGWINSNAMIMAAQPGRDLMPARQFYNGIYKSSYEIMVPENSPLKTLDDLKGKKIGVGAMSWANVPVTKSMLKDLGMELARDYQLLPVGIGAPALRALQDGSIDAINLFDTLHLQMEAAGQPLRRLPQSQKYDELYSSGWMAHNDTLRDRPDLVVKFARAAAKGVVACNANPRACVENFWQMYPAAKPSQGTEEQKMNDALKALQVRLDSMIPAGGVSKMGYFTDEGWNNYVDVLHAGGVLKVDKLPVDVMYTNDFVAKINDFDVAAVEAAAKAK